MIPQRTLKPELLAPELEFSTSRSSGPGGQNVNKVNSKVTLRWDVRNSILITPEEKEIILQKLSAQITTDGVLLITAQDSRSQLQNKEGAVSKLGNLLGKAFTKRKKRKASKPSKSSVLQRLDKKKKHAAKKRWRQNRLE